MNRIWDECWNPLQRFFSLTVVERTSWTITITTRTEDEFKTRTISVRIKQNRPWRTISVNWRKTVILLSSSSQKWRILQIYFLLENILVQCLLSNSTKIRPPPDIFKNIPKSPPLPYPSISKVCACLGFFNIQLNTYISCIKVWDIQIFQDLVICPKEDPYHEVGGGEFEGMSEVE